jgi:hypothetical protein
MRNIFVLFGMLAIVGSGSRVFAQPDSTWLSAGYLNLKRNLTQTITIKGEDLEKMPFANLSDAIAAWLYGAYTQPATLQYIVDGSPVDDVNSYSVYDIDEVILVENAAAMAVTGGGQQEVVLIRTRRGKGKAGLTAAAQTGLVNGNMNGVSTDTRWYHQYYLGANVNPGSWRFGASANWLRDVQPISGAYQVVTPDNLQRWRLHGYAEWQPDKHEQLELAVGYAPEEFRMGTDSVVPVYMNNVRSSASQRFFLPELSWRGHWLGGLTNELQATYVQSVYQGAELGKNLSDTSSDYYYTDSIGGDRSSYHVFVRDRLAYRLSSGGWRIEPAMNVSYEHAKERLNWSQGTYGDNGQGFSIYSGNLGSEWFSYHDLSCTPQVSIRYKEGIDFEVGDMIQGVRQELPGAQKAFFFISSSFDVLHLANEHSSSGLTFFGSYAQRALPPFSGYQLADLTYGYTNQNQFGAAGGSLYGPTANGNVYYEAAQAQERFWVWEAGVRYTGWKDRLQIQGNIERRNYALLDYILTPVSGNYTSIDGVSQLASHMLLHLDARVKVVEGVGGGWESGINATILNSKVTGVTSTAAEGGLVGSTGDVYPNPYSVTGGWVNRFRVRHFIGGVDLLYHFGETYFTTGPGIYPALTRKVSSVAVPNIFAGYRFGPAHKGAEVFVESRGLARSNRSDLLDGRRYYTIGGKLTL